jgi:hypothetical protein
VDGTSSLRLHSLYYHFALLLLFQPFVRLRLIASDVLPRDVCIQACRAISALVKSYSKLYALKKTPAFLPFICFASTVFQIAVFHDEPTNPGSKEELLQNIADLKDMRSSHGFAIRALSIIRFLAGVWKIDFLMEEISEGKLLQDIADQFSPLIGGILMMENIKRVSSMSEDPLFAPFPEQGLPSLAVGSQLEENGFMRL